MALLCNVRCNLAKSLSQGFSVRRLSFITVIFKEFSQRRKMNFLAYLLKLCANISFKCTCIKSDDPNNGPGLLMFNFEIIYLMIKL